MSRVRFPVVVERDEDGVYIVSCPVLQGCHSYGRTLEEALANIREAIAAHIEARRAVGDPVPVAEKAATGQRPGSAAGA